MCASVGIVFFSFFKGVPGSHGLGPKAEGNRVAHSLGLKKMCGSSIYIYKYYIHTYIYIYIYIIYVCILGGDRAESLEVCSST